MRSDMRRALWVFLGTMLAGVATFSVILYLVWSYPDRSDGSAEGNVEITIPRGATAQDVSELLQKAGLIESPALFRLYTAQRGAAARIRTGNYQVKAPITPKELVDTLMKGAADRLVTVTIPEGKNFVEIADILEAAGVTRKAEFIAAAINPALSCSSQESRACRWRGTCSPTPTDCAPTPRPPTSSSRWCAGTARCTRS